VFAKDVARSYDGWGRFVVLVLDFELQSSLEMSSGLGWPLHAPEDVSILAMDVWRSVVVWVGDGEGLAIPSVRLRKAAGLREIEGLSGQA
jgi:hypothetical protein